MAEKTADMIIFVDDNINWNFIPNQYEIKEDEFDLESVIVHELLHGMGFTSELKIVDDITNQLRTRFVQFKAAHKQRLMPISIYDSLIHSNHGSISDIGQIFEDTLAPLTCQEHFEMKLQQDSEFMTAIKKLHLIATSKYSHLKFMDGSTAYLKTSDNLMPSTSFVPGTSLCHFNDLYYKTSDFLLTSGTVKGSTLNSEMLRTNSTSVLGPRTRKTLEHMGWDLGNGPRVKFVDILPESFLDIEGLW